MIEPWLDVLGCPTCRRPLQLTGQAGTELRCQHCGLSFSVDGSMPVLLRPEDRARLLHFSLEYRDARLRDGWQPLSLEEAQALPYGQPPGYPPLYWQVRRQSFAALMSVLAREGPSPANGPAADLGAGIGWLGYRLAQLGYRVVAVEASQDQDFGLGAAERYYASQMSFLPVQGNLEFPPLQAGALGLVVFNASLHYAADLAATLGRAAELLQSGGRLIVLDTPIARQPRPGTGRGDRHLGRAELQGALLEAGLQPRWLEVRRGHQWWLHQARALLRRDARFSFPIIFADKP